MTIVDDPIFLKGVNHAFLILMNMDEHAAKEYIENIEGNTTYGKGFTEGMRIARAMQREQDQNKDKGNEFNLEL